MKDIKDLQNAWARHEQKLDQSLRLNVELIKKVNFSTTRSKLNSLIWQNFATIAFFSSLAVYGVIFSVENSFAWYFIVSGLLLTVWASVNIYCSVVQLKLILSLDYSLPVPELQKRLIKTKLALVKYLRLAFWTLPIYLVFMIVPTYAVLGVDIIQRNDATWLNWNLLLSFIFLVAAIYLQSKSVEKNLNKKWINRLLQGHGSQLDEALVLMKEIEDFEKEVA